MRASAQRSFLIGLGTVEASRAWRPSVLSFARLAGVVRQSMTVSAADADRCVPCNSQLPNLFSSAADSPKQCAAAMTPAAVIAPWCQGCLGTHLSVATIPCRLYVVDMMPLAYRCLASAEQHTRAALQLHTLQPATQQSHVAVQQCLKGLVALIQRQHAGPTHMAIAVDVPGALSFRYDV